MSSLVCTFQFSYVLTHYVNTLRKHVSSFCAIVLFLHKWLSMCYSASSLLSLSRDWKLHRVRDFGPSCSQVCPQDLEKWLAHSRCLGNVDWLDEWMKLSWWAFQVRGLQSCPTVFTAWYSMVDRAGGGPLLCVAILCGWTLSLSLSSVQKWILCPCHLVHMCTCLSRVDNKKWHSWVIRSAWF